MTLTSNAPIAQLLATYSADGRQRELHAIQLPGEQTIAIIDVLKVPLDEDGDLDPRHVDDRIRGLDEAAAVAADYIDLAARIGRSPMPELWW
jgi:hypothetical protein